MATAEPSPGLRERELADPQSGGAVPVALLLLAIAYDLAGLVRAPFEPVPTALQVIVSGPYVAAALGCLWPALRPFAVGAALGASAPLAVVLTPWAVLLLVFSAASWQSPGQSSAMAALALAPLHIVLAHASYSLYRRTVTATDRSMWGAVGILTGVVAVPAVVGIARAIGS